MARKGIYYNRTNTCDAVDKDGNKCENKLSPKKAFREYDKGGKWTGNWLCIVHYGIQDRKRPDHTNNLLKSVANIRTNNQNKNHSGTKADNTQRLTCTWLGPKDLNIVHDTYNYPIDHSPIPNDTKVSIGHNLVDLSGKIPQTKCRRYDSYYQKWKYNVEGERLKDVDIIICYCLSEDGSIIERIYIFPIEEIYERTAVSIYKYCKNGFCYHNSKGELYISGWYEKYRVTNEEEIKIINKIWVDKILK